MRVRDGRPSVLEHLCIDCTCCIAACAPARAHPGRRRGRAGARGAPGRRRAGAPARPAGRLRRARRRAARAGRARPSRLCLAHRRAALRRGAARRRAGARRRRRGGAPGHLARLPGRDAARRAALSRRCFRTWRRSSRRGRRCRRTPPGSASPVWSAAPASARRCWRPPPRAAREVVDLPTPGLVRRAVLPALAVGRDQARVGAAAAAEPPTDGVLHVSGVTHVLGRPRADRERPADRRLRRGAVHLRRRLLRFAAAGRGPARGPLPLEPRRRTPALTATAAPCRAAGLARRGPASGSTPTWPRPSRSSPGSTSSPARCRARTAAPAARPRAPRSPRTSSWSAQSARSAPT